MIENHLFFFIWLKIQMYLVHRGTHMSRFFKILSIGHSNNFYRHIFEDVEIHRCAGGGLTKTRYFILSSCHQVLSLEGIQQHIWQTQDQTKIFFDWTRQWRNASLCQAMAWPRRGLSSWAAVIKCCHWEAFRLTTTHLINSRSNKQNRNFDWTKQWWNASLCRRWPDQEEVFHLEQLSSSVVIGRRSGRRQHSW